MCVLKLKGIHFLFYVIYIPYRKKMIFKENGIFTKNIIASILKTKEFSKYRKKVIKGREKWGIY